MSLVLKELVLLWLSMATKFYTQYSMGKQLIYTPGRGKNCST